jgi:hypothetical protein
MAKQNPTVTTLSCVLNVVELTIAKNVNKGTETPATCALCGGNHPANYKGCEHYHNLIKGNNTLRNNTSQADTNMYEHTTVSTRNDNEATQR